MSRIFIILLVMFILEGCSGDVSPPETNTAPITNANTSNNTSNDDIQMTTDPSTFLPLWVVLQ